MGYVDEKLDKPLPGPPSQGVSIRFWQVEAPVADSPAKRAGLEVVRRINPELLPPTSGHADDKPWRGVSRAEFDVLKKAGGRKWEAASYDDHDFTVPPINYTTVAEMTTFVRQDPRVGRDPDGLDPFTRCAAQLGLLVRAYRLADHGSLVGRVGYQRLPPLVRHFWRDPTDHETGGFLGDAKVLLLAHLNTVGLGIANRPVDAAMHSAIAHFTGRLLAGDPFVLAAEHLHDGRRSFQTQGDTAAAALSYAMGAEILLDALLGHLLWEEDVERGVPDYEKAAQELSADLARRVRKSFHDRLGGNWSTKGTGPVARWRTDVAQLRGRIVHRGYRPTEAECDAASRAAVDLLDFVKTRLAAQIRRYPRTAFVLLQGQGIDNRGLWPEFGPWAEAHRDEPEYSRWYSSWRDDVDTTLRRLGGF